MPSVSNFLRRKLPLQQFSGELIHTERILAAARLILTLSSVMAVYFDSTDPFRYNRLVYGLLLLYLAHAISVAVLLQFRTEISPRFAFTVHAVDIVAPSIISLFTNGPDSPFFLFFIFTLLGAAFRWGMLEALLTAVAAVATIACEAILLTHGLGRVIGAEFDVKSFLMRSTYLAIFALLIGYLAESEKRRRKEASIISQIAAKARVDIGLRGTLQATLHETLKAFGGREAILVASESGAQRANFWHLEILPATGEPVLTARQLEEAEKQRYLFLLPQHCAGAAWKSSSKVSTGCVRKDGSRLSAIKAAISANFSTHHRCHSLLVSTASAAPDLSARLFLFEPTLSGPLDAQLRFLQQLTNQVTPAVYNVYLLRRLRSRAAAVERARVARDLHDGVIQSLHAMAFRLYALRTSNLDSKQREAELLELQDLIHKEAANIRTLIQQLKPMEVDPRHLIEFLSSMIERYRYDTGIGAALVCDIPEISMPPQTCREVARIVQEALANVLKHSGAENVVVRLASDKDTWKLAIEDDGRGFEFAGRYSQAELDKSRRGPFVIKERVRAIGGELSIESKPGQGATLTVTFPRLAHAATA